ncbi:MAG: type 2 isopentenyl-diphosphate Delta-isomerase [Desulfurococcales archaeon]|nr:type 2 isopentenyl-diphosphate Delta-isomerase [Desulfurococcales archaeon]
MAEGTGTLPRKLDHIRIAVEKEVESGHPTLLGDVRIVHQPAPEVDLDSVDLSVEVFGKRLSAPLMITGMTGGHPDVEWVNAALARVAERHGIAIGVGSQRAAIEDPSVEETYRVVRREAPTTVVVANLGAPQLVLGYGVEEALRAVEMVRADALAIHLNPAQEAFQLEGDTRYRGLLRAVKEIVDNVGVPVVVKETGTGLSMEAVRQLSALGVECFDVSGLGGTNWVKVEVLRARERGVEPPRPPDGFTDYWGNPTALAVVEARVAAPRACVIASGGIRTGLDAARAIALGADLAGVALPALRALYRGGDEALDRLIASLKEQLRVAAYLAGAPTVRDLMVRPLTITGRLREELEARGISLGALVRAKIARLMALGRRV